MKKSLRFASAALALTLAAGCAMPAFAAGKNSFSKSETVYAVMNGDGSIKSTTVSEHLYSASGLANVTDKTTLTDIQNTESDAEFTQNGEELVWNTNDTDVYYKGNTDKALPIDVKVTYALDGQEAALEDIIGKSGHLTVTVNLKNNETGTVNVNGKDRTIVTPLITAVGVILGGDASNVTAEHGMVVSAGLDPAGPSNPLLKTVDIAAGAWFTNFSNYPVLWLVPVLAVLGAFGGVFFAKQMKGGMAIVCSSVMLLGIILTPLLSMFPFIMPSSSDPRSSLTIWDCTSSQLTLEVMLFVTLLLLPLVLIYTGWAYRTMSGKLNAEYIRKNDHDLY